MGAFGGQSRSARRSRPSIDEVESVIQAVGDVIVESGFRGATLGLIANRAELSVETVAAVGSKSELAVLAFRLAMTTSTGISEEPSFHDPVIAAISAEQGNDTALQVLADHVAAVNPRRCALWKAAREAAAHDNRFQAVIDSVNSARRDSDRILAGICIGRGFAPIGTDRDMLAGYLGHITSLETYDYFTEVHRFSQTRYENWLYGTLRLLSFGLTQREAPSLHGHGTDETGAAFTQSHQIRRAARRRTALA